MSIGEREAGVASVSAPVRGPNNRVVAAVSVSGPLERLGRQPGRIACRRWCCDRRKADRSTEALLTLWRMKESGCLSFDADPLNSFLVMKCSCCEHFSVDEYANS
jgi:hypothetical protein